MKTNDESTQNGDMTQKVDKDSAPSEEPLQPDGGWGWIVCLTATLNYGTSMGLMNSLSILYVIMLKEFSDDNSAISFRTCE